MKETPPLPNPPLQRTFHRLPFREGTGACGKSFFIGGCDPAIKSLVGEIIDLPRTNKGGRTMFARPPEGLSILFRRKVLGVHRGLLRKVTYAGADRVRDLKGVGNAHDLVEHFGWRSQNAIGSPIPSVGETFPCRLVFAPKESVGAEKNFPAYKQRRAHDVRTSSVWITYSFSSESFEGS